MFTVHHHVTKPNVNFQQTRNFRLYFFFVQENAKNIILPKKCCRTDKYIHSYQHITSKPDTSDSDKRIPNLFILIIGMLHCLKSDRLTKTKFHNSLLSEVWAFFYSFSSLSISGFFNGFSFILGWEFGIVIWHSAYSRVKKIWKRNKNTKSHSCLRVYVSIFSSIRYVFLTAKDCIEFQFHSLFNLKWDIKLKKIFNKYFDVRKTHIFSGEQQSSSEHEHQ